MKTQRSSLFFNESHRVWPGLRSKGDALFLDVLLVPRARVNQVMGAHGARLKVTVTAPPVDGKANAALVALLAEWLGVAKSQVSVERGLSSRNKTVSIKGSAQVLMAAADKIWAALANLTKG